MGNKLNPVVPALQAALALVCIVLSGYTIPNYPAVRAIQSAILLAAGALAVLMLRRPAWFSPAVAAAAAVLTAVGTATLSIAEIRFFLPRALDADPLLASFYIVVMVQNMFWCFALAYTETLSASLPFLALTLVSYLFLYFKLSSGSLFFLFFLIVATLGGFGVFRLFAVVREQHLKEKALIAERARLYGELEKAEARLIAEERRAAAAVLSAEIVHEVQNPVNYMAGNLQFLEEHIGLLVEEKTAREDRRRAAEDAESILSRFKEGLDRIAVAIDRARSGRALGAERRKRSVEAEPIIRRAAEEVRAASIEARGKDIAIEVDCSDAGLFNGDDQDLFSIVKNLIQNSAEAIPERGSISVRTETADGVFSLSVTDSGTGIPAELRERVFEPFYTTKAAAGNLGVGLSLSRKIVQAYEGDLSLEAAPSGGTIATVRFPPRDA